MEICTKGHMQPNQSRHSDIGTQPVSGTVALSALPLPPAPTTPYFLNSAPLPTERLLLLVQTVGPTSLGYDKLVLIRGASAAYVLLYNTWQPLRQWELTYQK